MAKLALAATMTATTTGVLLTTADARTKMQTKIPTPSPGSFGSGDAPI